MIYCDIPYKNTSQYLYSKDFDYEKFYNWCRQQSQNNIVFVSEYNMPDDFVEVWQGEIKTNINNRDGKSFFKVEKLFKL